VQVVHYAGGMPRDTLTRDRIVAAAIEVLDADGTEGLSMRHLGSKLNSAATAVYWHVKSKEELVSLAADEVWGEVPMPDPGQVGWRQAAAIMATGLHDMAARHPWLLSAMSMHLLYGPGKARHDDHCIAVYEAAGFRGTQTEWAMATVFMYVLGRALGESAEAAWRARLRREGGNEEEQIQQLVTEVNKIALQFPHLREHLEAMGDVDPTDIGHDFEFGLQTVLLGLEAQLAAGRSGPAREQVAPAAEGGAPGR
jgi:AcrR family transcriptional regulator